MSRDHNFKAFTEGQNYNPKNERSEMMNLLILMYSISIGISLVLLGFIIYSNRFGSKKEKQKIELPKVQEKKPEKTINHDNYHEVPIGDLRHYGDIDLSPGEGSFFIGRAAQEALGIYLSVTPTIVDTLMKVAKLADEVNSIIETDRAHIDRIAPGLNSVIQTIEPLVGAADRLNFQIYHICQKSQDENEQVEISEDLIRGFVNNSKIMIHYAMEYLHLANVLKLRLEKSGFSLMARFNSLNNDFIHIFFIGILNCTSMLDETIRVMK